jgi:hypothetical protein
MGLQYLQRDGFNSFLVATIAGPQLYRRERPTKLAKAVCKFVMIDDDRSLIRLLFDGSKIRYDEEESAKAEIVSTAQRVCCVTP